MRKPVLFGVAIAILVAVMAAVSSAPLRRELKNRLARPSVAWVSARPESEGLDAPALRLLWDDLEAKGTRGFALARGGRLVFERYAGGAGANTRHGASAASKALAATVIVLAGVTDGLVALDDSLSRYIPELRADSVRAKIRLRHLIDHTSGIEDVDFVAGENGRLEGWKRTYYDERSRRYHDAFRVAPVRFEPGSRMEYSGVGFYALAYAFGRVLHATPHHDVKRYYAERIMRPLEVPDEAWDLNYREANDVDGMTLYAFGSGATFTARAALRVGQLVLDRGAYEGRTLFDGAALDDLFRYDDPSSYHGWLLNDNGDWPSLPRDAVLGVGGSHNTICVVPSLDLVVVRFGASLGDDQADRATGVLDDRLFAPLMKAVIGPSARGG